MSPSQSELISVLLFSSIIFIFIFFFFNLTEVTILYPSEQNGSHIDTQETISEEACKEELLISEFSECVTLRYV